MLSFNWISIRFVGALVALLLLAGCTISPVYSDRSQSANIFELAFASPNSRLEQIVYSELVSSFARSTSPDALLVSVAVSSYGLSPGVNNVALKAIVNVTDPSGQSVFSGTRTASASFAGSGQSLANQQAANEAAERAARQLGQTIRLTLIGVLSARASQTTNSNQAITGK